MKKLILSLFCFCLFASTMAQQNLTPAQQEIQSEIFEFLRTEGFVPSIDEEGSIAFRSEGEPHLIRIFFENPFFVYLQRGGYLLGEGGIDNHRALLASNTVNANSFGAKSYLAATVQRFAMEQYFSSVEVFKRVFRTSLKVLAEAEATFVQEYIRLRDSQ